MEFQPLSREDGEMRLVRFDFQGHGGTYPPTGDQFLSLQLEHQRHKEAQYVALSYVWGDPDDLSTILINGITVLIRRNLHNALARLWQQGLESWIWVDAICIDQAHNEEKSWQVGIMQDIFNLAETVYHWLGPEADDSDFLLDWVAIFGREASEAGVLDFVMKDLETQEMQILRFLRSSYPDLMPEPDHYAYTNLPGALAWMSSNASAETLTETPNSNTFDSTHKAVPFLVQLAINNPEILRSNRMSKALEALLQRDFFHRLWIVQELGVSRNGIFLCGNLNVPVDCFDSALAVADTRLSKWTVNKLRKSTQHDWLRGFNGNLLYPPGLTVRRARGSRLPSLLAVLLCSMGPADGPMFAATDPRDIIFGLLGIIRDANQLGIDVDYSKSAVDVFTQATNAFIRHDKAYCLGFSTFPKDLAGLPSWVPDWARMGRQGMPFFPISYGNFPKYKASSDTQQTEHPIPDARDVPILTLSGFRLGCATSVMALHSVTSDAASIDEIGKFCLANGVVDDSVIIRTCLMDDATLLGICAKPDTRYLDFASKAFRAA